MCYELEEAWRQLAAVPVRHGLPLVTKLTAELAPVFHFTEQQRVTSD